MNINKEIVVVVVVVLLILAILTYSFYLDAKSNKRWLSWPTLNEYWKLYV